MLILGDMQAIKEMAKLGTGVGIVIADGTLSAVKWPGSQIRREWGVFRSTQREPSLVEEAFTGLCEMGFENMPG